MFETIDSMYGKKFKSYDLNNSKYSEIFEEAVELRDFRNKLSEHYWDNFEIYINMNSNDFLKEIRANFDSKLCSLFDYDQITSVHTAYQNRTKSIIHGISFSLHTYNGMNYYKCNTKYHKKGDFKSFKFKDKKTLLTIALTYLARYGNENTVEYINTQLNKEDVKQDKKEYYKSILSEIEKFSFERLYKLALARRKRIYEEYRKRDAIKFESLTFGARSRKNVFITYNKHFGSKINAFILLSWKEGKTVAIPVKYSKKFHGSMKLYNEKTGNYQYEITFDEKHKEIFVHYTIPGKREVFDARTCKEFIGVDENLKHNMYTLSSEIEDNDGNKFDTVDYDRDLLKEFIVFQKTLEKYKKSNPNYHMGKTMRKKSESLKKRMKSSERETIAFMCECIKKSRFNHIVAEDLSGCYGKTYATNEDGINYNDLLKFVGFYSLPDELIRIAHKHGVAVSLVQSAYTSQMCPRCGHIHRNNRKTQEVFICEKCNYKAEADAKSAHSILERGTSDVLVNKLLNLLDNGEYRPKALKRSTVK